MPDHKKVWVISTKNFRHVQNFVSEGIGVNFEAINMSFFNNESGIVGYKGKGMVFCGIFDIQNCT